MSSKQRRHQHLAIAKRQRQERQRVREAERVARQKYIPTNLRGKGSRPEWYDEYLKTPHWRAFKVRYRQSDRPQACVICGNPRYELHHVTYERIGYEQLDDVVSLCRAHHARAHRQEVQGVPLREAHLSQRGHMD